MSPLYRGLAAASSALAILSASAQSTGLLYDPDPPPDSAYVRVINVTGGATLEVLVDGRARIAALGSAQASDYLVLPAGQRVLEIRSGGKESARVALDVPAGRAMSVAFPTAHARPWIFEDKANTNKLKAVLGVYNLAPDVAVVDVVTADGAAKVATGLRAGASSALPVNPINIELMATAPGASAALARAAVSMVPGGTYTWMLFKGKAGLEARAFQNKVERYTR
jgi:alginate O-acetyltransferase complex protein AlgF